jgi:hypothetical protein
VVCVCGLEIVEETMNVSERAGFVLPLPASAQLNVVTTCDVVGTAKRAPKSCGCLELDK